MDPTHPCFHFDMGHVHMNVSFNLQKIQEEINKKSQSQFHFGYCENVLFGFWKVRSVETLVGSACGIFVMAILFEALKAYRY
jgi:Ctr copper transporter family